MKHIQCLTKVPQRADTLEVVLAGVFSILGSIISLLAIAGGIAWGVSKGNPSE